MTGTGSPAASVPTGLDTPRPWQEDFYRHLHQHPELSHQEHNTAAEVASRLGTFGYRVHEGIGGTGVVGGLRHGDGPTGVLRADKDAPPGEGRARLAEAGTGAARGLGGGDGPG